MMIGGKFKKKVFYAEMFSTIEKPYQIVFTTKFFFAKIFLGQLFCIFLPLGVLFTNRAFEELVLGLSWRGNPELDGVGGICQSR